MLGFSRGDNCMEYEAYITLNKNSSLWYEQSHAAIVQNMKTLSSTGVEFSKLLRVLLAHEDVNITEPTH